ncbi:hypothetical protein AKJ56_02260 [candidate division MSBL1 archaeon SCGC-AAA382N08]|uniref:Uncharacterized protein n=1 Tax=candidate division MSBL1 archaeon SCGC-AAA382N08 TaxID=1698285 RepID=A0A133VN08_9EURY|nr:hypothetical protein AKJ56_02260 [candidate division MSBL1 archaeon SCGC-AAA382N08]
MFQKSLDFGYQRDLKEAIGFYITYLFFTILLEGPIAGMIRTFIGDEGVVLLTTLLAIVVGGLIAGVVTSLTLSFLVLKSKNLLSNFKYVGIGLMSGILALFGGGLLGLLPVAFLTTREKKLSENT